MARTFRAGLVGAYMQGIMAVVVTCAFLAIAWWNAISAGLLTAGDGRAQVAVWMEGHAVHLRYSDLLVGIGLILARNRFFGPTSEDIRRQSAWTNPVAPRQELNTVFHQLLIAALCFAIATLHRPPHLVVMAASPLGPAWIASAVWSGILSMATVAFGISAVAARQALR